MADENLNNQGPASASAGGRAEPPPSGGGSFDDSAQQRPQPQNSEKREGLLAKWKPEVLTAATALNFNVPLDEGALGEGSYANLNRIQKISRKQLELLTIARKLYRLQRGSWPQSPDILRNYFLENQGRLESLWQEGYNYTHTTGIPRIFSDNYTLPEVQEWLEENRLFGFRKTEGRTPETKEEAQATETVQARPASKPAAAAKPSIQTPPAQQSQGVQAPRGPQVRPSQVASLPDDVFDDEISEETAPPLPGGLAGTGVVKNSQRLASSAKPGPRLRMDNLPGGTKRSKNRARGKTRGQQRAAGGARATQTTNVEAAGGGGGVGVNANLSTQAESEAEESGSQLFGEAQVLNQIPRASIGGGESVGVIADDYLTPGFDADQSGASGTAQTGGSGATIGRGSSGARALGIGPATRGGGGLSVTQTGAGQAQPGVSGGATVAAPAGVAKTPGGVDAVSGAVGAAVGGEAVAAVPAAVEQAATAPAISDQSLAPGQISAPRKGKSKAGAQLGGGEAVSAETPSQSPGLGPDGQSLISGLGQGDNYLAPQLAPGEQKSPQAKLEGDVEGEAEQEQKEPGEDEEDDQDNSIADSQALDRFNSLNPAEQLAHINNWLGKGTQKKRRMPTVSGLRLRLLETASLKYPELKELLDEVKKEAYRAAHGLDPVRGQKKFSKTGNMEDEFWFWVQKVFAEYIIKTWLFPYVSVSAFFDGGIEAVLALIGLHLYWFASMLFKHKGIFQGLLRWQKWLLAGIDIVVGLIIFFIFIVAVYGFCQLPGAGFASSVASTVTSNPVYTFCSDINGAVTGVQNSPAAASTPK